MSEHRDDRPRTLVDPSVTTELVATGFRFTEGPLWDARNESLLFNDIPADIRYRWRPRVGAQVISTAGHHANGQVFDAQHELLICEHSSSALVWQRRDGSRQVLASHFRGRELNSPNDVVTSTRRDVYFTDPWYGRMSGWGRERPRDLAFQGVYRLAAGADVVQLVVEANEFAMPNGLCLSPDETLLYVNDTERRHIKVFDVLSDGTLGAARMFFTDIGAGSQDTAPDGMKCDAQGNVWVTGPGGVWVIAADGARLGIVPIPEEVANLTWGGTGWRILYLTCTSSLYRLPTLVTAARLPYHTAPSNTPGEPW